LNVGASPRVALSDGGYVLVMKRSIHFAFALFALFALAPVAAAQELSSSQRSRAVADVRSMAACVAQGNVELQRVLSLVREAEEQRDRGRDERVRQDAERSIDALVARAATLQRDMRACVGGDDLPSPGTEVVVRDAPRDRAEDSVAENTGTVRTIEENAALGDQIRVVRAEQVDGEGRLDAPVVRSAVRSIASRLDRCYEVYLDRGSMEAREIDLVFTVATSGRTTAVELERSGFDDARFEQCLRTAARAIAPSRAPRGGEAIYSYRLRFGR
jgi:hypothetical protein